MVNRWETMETLRNVIWGGAPKSLQIVTVAMKLKDSCSLGEKTMTNLDSILKKQRHHFANKDPSS